MKITKQGICEKEIKSRIEQGRIVTRKLNSVLWNKHIKNNTRRIYKSIIESILFIAYAVETWTTPSVLEKKLLSTEMNYWRRACGLILKNRLRNEQIREE